MMRFALWMSAFVVLLSGFVTAQEETPPQQPDFEEYQKQFDKGIKDLTEGRHDDGIEAFKKCLEIIPEDSTCAYNVSCGYSLKKDIDNGVAWFEKAVVWGFGMREGNIEHAEKDTDLDNMREDERFVALMQQMRDIKAAVEQYAGEPAVYIPEALKEGEAWPILMVLHDNGATKDGVIGSYWKEVADANGCALIAPSGKTPIGTDPTQGMLWFNNIQEYQTRYWTFERSASDAILKFRKEHKVDRARVFIAGDGIGGMVAFNMAVRAPGLYKGVVLHHSRQFSALAAERASSAGRRGLKARIIFNEKFPLLGFAPGTAAADVTKALKGELDQWKIDNQVSSYASENMDKEAFLDHLKSAVASLMPQPEPAEEGAGTGQ